MRRHGTNAKRKLKVQHLLLWRNRATLKAFYRDKNKTTKIREEKERKRNMIKGKKKNNRNHIASCGETGHHKDFTTTKTKRVTKHTTKEIHKEYDKTQKKQTQNNSFMQSLQ